MATQHWIEVTYSDDSTEEYVCHSDESIEWIEQQPVKKLTAFVSLLSINKQVMEWLRYNNAKKIEVVVEPE